MSLHILYKQALSSGLERHLFDFSPSDFSSFCPASNRFYCLSALPLIAFSFYLLSTEFLYGVPERISDLLNFLLCCLLSTEAFGSGLIDSMLV
jgi:hypothetical protein